MLKTMVSMLFALTTLMAGFSATLSAQTAPHFVVSIDPSAVNIVQGGIVTMTVTTMVEGRLPFEFSFAGLPAGVIAQTRRGRTGANTIVLTALPNAPTGSYSVDVTATTGNSSQTQTFTLNVKPGPPIQWEYHAVVISSGLIFDDVANALGQQGWELVSVVVRADETIAFFKREKF